MAKRAIREYDAKRMMARGLAEASGGRFSVDERLCLVGPDTDLDALPAAHPWLLTTRLVAKPDQLFGKRGKNGLLCIDATWERAKAWILERMNREVTIEQTTGRTTGTLTHFLVEPLVPHGREYYVGITTARDCDRIFVSTQGGVDIEEAWDSVHETQVGILDYPAARALDLPDVGDQRETLEAFVRALYAFFREYHFSYLELNPFALEGGRAVPMDCKARVDDYASYVCAEKWGELEFPKAFGMAVSPEERRVEDLDERTGASLKLTVLNPDGRVWNLVAGGGASVIYADTVVDLGLAGELANYGEYSGDPSREFTREYTRVVLDLATRKADPQGRPKYLLVGGGIANFTDVAATFAGILDAIEEFAERMKAVGMRVYVRRGGPNYPTGLKRMRETCERLGLPVAVFGPETHMTQIVRMVREAEGHPEVRA
jgi:ATP-citrate lyase beta-subunit